jgi:uncharacterized protein (TIRG00374 family)
MVARKLWRKPAELVGARRVGKKVVLLLKVAISLGLVLALGWRFRGDIPSLATVDRQVLIGAIALLLLQPGLIGIRWWLLLRQYNSHSTLVSLAGITWFAVFANQFLPAGVGGDAVRIYYARQLGDRLGAATASVMMDRILALVALVLMVVALAPFLPAVIDRRLIFALGALCAACVAVLVAIYIFVSRSKHAPLSSPLAQRLLSLTHYVLRTFSFPVQSLVALSISVAVHILSFSAFMMIARSLGIDVSAGPLMAVTALLTFIQIMPISIGGWGVREVAAVSLLGMLGVDPGSALLASLLTGLSYAAASLPGVAIWPFVKVRSSQSLSDDADAAAR